MPIYTYKCQCGQTSEAQHSVTEDPEVLCDDCKLPMKRTFHAPNIQFNGSGFYSTDK